jgi:hypothetical protein
MLNRQVTFSHGLIRLENHRGNFYITISTFSNYDHAVISVGITDLDHQWKHYYNYAVSLNSLIDQIIRDTKRDVADAIYESI